MQSLEHFAVYWLTNELVRLAVSQTGGVNNQPVAFGTGDQRCQYIGKIPMKYRTHACVWCYTRTHKITR